MGLLERTAPRKAPSLGFFGIISSLSTLEGKGERSPKSWYVTKVEISEKFFLSFRYPQGGTPDTKQSISIEPFSPWIASFHSQ